MSQNIFDNVSKIIHIETLGCRLNQIESESLANFFANDNFIVQMKSITSKQAENKDVILAIVNTCTVTAKAEQKARRIIRLLVKKFPFAIIVVTGCYAQVNAEEILNISENIVVLAGRLKSRLEKVPKIIKKILDEGDYKTTSIEQQFIEIQKKIKQVLLLDVCAGQIPLKSEHAFRLSTDTFLNHSRSSLKIQDGCNNRCTYCEICIARGQSVSLEVPKVLEQVKKLKAAGQKEIVFTTVNIAQYRGELKNIKFDQNEKNKNNLIVDEAGKKFVNFAGLLEILLRETSEIKFRFSSLYPQIVDEYFAQLIKDDRVQPHFHLSVQSGSDKILTKMARPYNAKIVENACKLLNRSKKNPFLACDIIAGFPTETDADFESTKVLLKKCNFSFVHAFPFSPRPNTKAFLMKPKVSEYIIKQRVQWLLDFSVNQKIEYINNLIHSKQNAIVETSNTKNEVHCVTDNFLHCIVELEKNQKIPVPKSLIKVEIIKPLIENINSNLEYDVLVKII